MSNRELAKTIAIKFSNQIKELLGNKLSKVILYGSYARGDYKDNSDIDIMVLTILTNDEISEIKELIFDLAFDFQMDYGFDISVIIKNKEHFEHWIGALPFYNNVQKEGIVLNG
jgi:predicted nucleotidyltransferase